jgi:cation:H+ antiporter
MLLEIGLLIVGLVLLTVGADWFVKGASRIATTLGIPPLIIGLTLVAFGTSAPELAVSLKGVFSGETDVTIGNVVGSNILNVLLILGLASVITPLAVKRSLARVDVPFLIAVSGLMWYFCSDLMVTMVEGIILFSLLNAYLLFLYFSNKGKKNTDFLHEIQLDNQEFEQEKVHPHWAKNLVYILVGITMLVFGSDLMVNNAISIAKVLDMSTLLISLTIVAIGTSLPEIATSVIAALRGEGDIAVGNIIGSNLFNILLVLGLSATIAPSGIGLDQQAINFDIPVMFGVALLCLPFFLSKGDLSKKEGAIFLSYYVVYTAGLIAITIQPQWLSIIAPVFYTLVLFTLADVAYNIYTSRKVNNTEP